MVLSGRKEESIRHLDKRALELGLNLANIEGRGAQLQGRPLRPCLDLPLFRQPRPPGNVAHKPGHARVSGELCPGRPRAHVRRCIRPHAASPQAPRSTIAHMRACMLVKRCTRRGVRRTHRLGLGPEAGDSGSPARCSTAHTHTHTHTHTHVQPQHERARSGGREIGPD